MHAHAANGVAACLSCTAGTGEDRAGKVGQGSVCNAYEAALADGPCTLQPATLCITADRCAATPVPSKASAKSVYAGRELARVERGQASGKALHKAHFDYARDESDARKTRSQRLDEQGPILYAQFKHIVLSECLLAFRSVTSS